MARLFAFGCSFTVGQGLPDIYPAIKPSGYAWPNVLGSMLGYEVVNKGIAGAGNAEIAASILRTDFKEDDLCVILWSHFTRYDYYVYHDDLTGNSKWGRNEFKNMLAKEPIDQDWWKGHNKVKNWLTINHVSLHLEKKNIRFMQMLGIVDSFTYPKIDLYFPNLIEDCMPHDFIIDRAMDAKEAPPGHPGMGSQRLIAQLFYDRISKQ